MSNLDTIKAVQYKCTDCETKFWYRMDATGSYPKTIDTDCSECGSNKLAKVHGAPTKSLPQDGDRVIE